MSLIFESSYYAFGFYVALNALVMLVLSVLVVRARVTTQTNIGDGGKAEMAAPLRAHGNNTEYVPTGLLLLLALVSPIGGGAPILLVHSVGATLTLGRIIHAVGLSRSTGTSLFRLIGMILTWLSFIIGIVGLFWLIFFSEPAPVT
jgi:uncharacterized membrane protein YecN with MAPEG domain